MKRTRYGEPLNEAETAALLALSAGCISHREIAARTNYSPTTLGNTMHTLRQKAGARSTTHLALMIGGVVPCPRNIAAALARSQTSNASATAAQSRTSLLRV